MAIEEACLPLPTHFMTESRNGSRRQNAIAEVM